MRSSLATHVRLLVIAICVGFGFSVLLTFRILANRQIDTTVREEVRSVSSILSTFIGGRGELLRSYSRFVARTPRLAQLAITGDSATVQDACEGLRKDLGIDALTITDGNGKVLGEAGFTEAIARNRENHVNVATALRGEEWSGVLKPGGDLMIAATEPLRIGEFVHGTLTTYLRMGADKAAEFRSAVDGEIAFVSQGVVTASSLPISERIATTSEPQVVRLNGVQYVVLYAPLPGAKSADMGFLAIRKVSDITAPYRQFTLAFVSVLSLVFLAALVTGAAFAKSIGRPLEAVVAAALKLKAGDWPERFNVTREDEVGILQSTFNDMTEALQRSQQKLLAMIDEDPLTELDNHRRFKERLEHEVRRCTSSGEPLSLLLLDIDHFKEFNERFGHAAGDAALRRVADAIRAACPELGSGARYGGEEFALVLPHHELEDAEARFEEIASALADIGVSGGCAAHREGARSDALLLSAELALSRAKQLGRGRVCRFDAVPGAEGEDPYALLRNMNDASYATVLALAAAVDAKDPYTMGHSERVATYASELAAYMNADKAEVDQIARAGALHDVGKIGVPDAILKKPGRLDEEEFRIMQTHPVLGELIVRKVPQLEELLPGVRSHHERFDGEGYPDGLAGEEIPRMARFLAIADTFDAMTSDRPYRRGMDASIALKEIEEQAGRQFDPEMALAFVRMMRRRQILQTDVAA